MSWDDKHIPPWAASLLYVVWARSHMIISGVVSLISVTKKGWDWWHQLLACSFAIASIQWFSSTMAGDRLWSSGKSCTCLHVWPQGPTEHKCIHLWSSSEQHHRTSVEYLLENSAVLPTLLLTGFQFLPIQLLGVSAFLPNAWIIFKMTLIMSTKST